MEYSFGVAPSLLSSILDNSSGFSYAMFPSLFLCCLFLTQTTIITTIINNPAMEAPIIIGIISDCVSSLSVTSGSFVVNRSVRSKNVVSFPSVQDILIIYSEVELT